jgi:hypothetical protein
MADHSGAAGRIGITAMPADAQLVDSRVQIVNVRGDSQSTRCTSDGTQRRADH